MLTRDTSMSPVSMSRQIVPTLQDAPPYVPTYKQKVNAYMRIDTDASTSSGRRSPSYTYGSVLGTALQEDNNPSPCTPPGSTRGATADDRFTHSKNPRMYKRTMGMSLFHLLMSRCQALQCIVNASECKPQTQKSTLYIHKTYSRIVSFAKEAMKIAEELESVALEARCEYWAGRGCGGLQDWQAAIIHFTNAMRLDGSHNNSKHTISSFEGLLWHEKEDIEFLLQNAKQRHNEWSLKTKKTQKSQHNIDTKDARGKDMKGFLWTPNLDLRNWTAKQQLEKSKQAGRRTNVFLPNDGQKVRKLWKHEIPMIRKRLAVSDGKDFLRRTLNANEWFYILRGLSTAEEENTSTNDQVATEREDSTVAQDIESTPASSPAICSLEQFPLEESLNLDDELQQSGFMDGEEIPSPSAGRFGLMTRPDVEEDLQQSPATASSHDPVNARATLPHEDSSGKGENRTISTTRSVSETGSTSMMDYNVRDNSVERTE